VRPPRPVLLALAAVPALAALAACGGGGGGDDGLAMDDLRDAGEACPVDLEAAVADSGLEASGDAEVEVTEGSGEGGMDASAIDRLGGVHVECRVAAGAGEVRAELIAAPEPGAALLFLPALQQALAVPSDELEAIAGRIDDTAEGEPVGLDGDAPVAIARVEVGDAESAALLVTGEGGASGSQVRSVAEDLLGEL
jgi:hypothetical protein